MRHPWSLAKFRVASTVELMRVGDASPKRFGRLSGYSPENPSFEGAEVLGIDEQFVAQIADVVRLPLDSEALESHLHPEDEHEDLYDEFEPCLPVRDG